MKYRGLAIRSLYANIGVEAENESEARRKLVEIADALSLDCYDYEDAKVASVVEMDEQEKENES